MHLIFFSCSPVLLISHRLCSDMSLDVSLKGNTFLPEDGAVTIIDSAAVGSLGSVSACAKVENFKDIMIFRIAASPKNV